MSTKGVIGGFKAHYMQQAERRAPRLRGLALNPVSEMQHQSLVPEPQLRVRSPEEGSTSDRPSGMAYQT